MINQLFFTPNNDNDDTGDKKSVNDFEEEKLNEDDRDSFTIGFISRALMISSLQLGILPLLLTK
ncbi:hypothetical protein Tco_1196884, partial [Tanacetum coccineum]